MSVIYIVLPVAILIAAIAVGAFLWAARRGQFDDLTTPAMRMLHEDEGAPRSGEEREPQARDDANDEVGADAQERRPEPPDRA